MINQFRKILSDNYGVLIRIDDVAENMNWEMFDKIEILFNKIIPINIIALNKIKTGFLLCTGNLITVTFFLSTYFNNSPPLVTINDLQPFSGK